MDRSDEKRSLVVESGVRIHASEHALHKDDAACTPNAFCMKLRKHLRNKRLERLAQVGLDRVVDMLFGVSLAIALIRY